MERTVEASSSLQQKDFFLCKIIYSLREHLMLAFAHFSLSSASNLMDHVPLPHPPVVSRQTHQGMGTAPVLPAHPEKQEQHQHGEKKTLSYQSPAIN